MNFEGYFCDSVRQYAAFMKMRSLCRGQSQIGYGQLDNGQWISGNGPGQRAVRNSVQSWRIRRMEWTDLLQHFMTFLMALDMTLGYRGRQQQYLLFCIFVYILYNAHTDTIHHFVLIDPKTCNCIIVSHNTNVIPFCLSFSGLFWKKMLLHLLLFAT